MLRRPAPRNAEPDAAAEAQQQLRRRQALGLLWLALAVFLFCALRAGRSAIFLPRWWHLW